MKRDKHILGTDGCMCKRKGDAAVGTKAARRQTLQGAFWLERQGWEGVDSAHHLYAVLRPGLGGALSLCGNSVSMHGQIVLSIPR